jgi:subtilisin family serine protease
MDSSSAEYEALLRALKNNVVFVTASGNSGTNIDKNKFFPARYDLENIISVMSLTDGNHMVASSNFGLNSVTVAAPGENIISTLPVGKYGKLTGTSQAAAFVAGLVVRILSGSRSDLDFRTIKKLLIVDSVEMTHLSQLVGSKGRVNLDRLSADDFMDLGRTASGRLYNK